MEVEKAKRLPTLSIGLNSQSIIGYQTIDQTERYFNGWDRFTSLQASIAVPIFSKAQRTRILAAEIQVLQQQNELDWLKQRSRAEQATARQQLQKHWASLQYFQNQGLPNAQTIVSTADRQFAAGEIDYLQWVLLVNQSFEIRSQYLEEQHRYNQAVLQYQLFSNE